MQPLSRRHCPPPKAEALFRPPLEHGRRGQIDLLFHVALSPSWPRLGTTVVSFRFSLPSPPRLPSSTKHNSLWLSSCHKVGGWAPLKYRLRGKVVRQAAELWGEGQGVVLFPTSSYRFGAEPGRPTGGACGTARPSGSQRSEQACRPPCWQAPERT